MKKTILLICFAFIIHNINIAQTSLASGYMGKKFAVGVENSMNIQFWSNYQYEGLSFDIRPYLQYSVYDRFAIRASYIPFKKSVLKTPDGALDLYYYTAGYVPHNYNTSSNHYFDPTIVGATFSFMLFNKGSISPIGACYSLQLGYYNLSSTNLIKPTLPTDFQQNFKCIEPAKYNANVYQIAFTFERNYVYFDCLNFNFGMSYGVNFPNILYLSENEYESSIYIKDPTDLMPYYANLINQMTSLSNGMRVHVAFAYIF